ncbi:hypothetical protein ETB97_012516 [Aspergillus alliaceus]|uniref:PARP-type domain-containing protein n=1 Tax=Petromyces alliaceus TaxID=209559 RepID=A0A5N7C7U5_PETAA|nr:uncharacterized protein BDW43DRAFT_164626 [Aspergillus alliaceus]KAB8230494.1 hypothetical protein BDW43DRAFT_164626 [Aspergillus alliaceus]KAE8389827.1 hypothetical protein BDV23DRAFT_156577 [Aspergillus alliaceus]KAF5866350.1 hypothetical protein ETB97_012516 [Aspergillus burnettii]
MPSYRLEQATTGRAGCQNKECKDQKVKIAKGELRLGSWVDSERIQAFFWRHWGCVTPKIITSLKEIVENEGEKDYDQLDGFEDLDPENQEKIKKALEQGHVDDAEWNGDVEMNRPGKSGFRVRGSKKKAASAEDSEAEEKSPEPKTKKRGRQSTKDEGKDEAPETPEAKKPKQGTRSKHTPSDGDKATKEETDDDTSAQIKPKKARKGRPSKTDTEEKEFSKAPAKTAAKPSARRQRKTAVADDEAERVEEKPVEKPKRGRKGKSIA